MPSDQPSRRQFLRRATVTTTVGLGGCTTFDSNQSPEQPTTRSDTPTASPRPTETTTTPDDTSQTEAPEQTPTSLPEICSSVDLSVENGVWILFDFAESHTLPDGRAVSLRIDEITMRGGTGHEKHTYDIGTPDAEPKLVEGAYEPESDGDRTYRWFEPTFALQFPAPTSWSASIGIDLYPDTSHFESSTETQVCSLSAYVETVPQLSWEEFYVPFRTPSDQ